MSESRSSCPSLPLGNLIVPIKSLGGADAFSAKTEVILRTYKGEKLEGG